MDDVAAFYDALADDYQSLFADWGASVVWQGEVIDGLIRSALPQGNVSILDATCGIGTQAIGLALRGYQVTATDVSAAAVERAKREASRLGASIEFGVADLRTLPDALSGSFDVVISFDNALPHLVEPEDLAAAFRSLRRVLRPAGVLLVSIRDYDAILESRPRGEVPRMSGQPGSRRLVVQAWEWDAVEPRYQLHQFVLREQPDGAWSARHFETRYRALRRVELETIGREAGFTDLRWLEPAATRFYQPILRARRA